MRERVRVRERVRDERAHREERERVRERVRDERAHRAEREQHARGCGRDRRNARAGDAARRH